MIKQLYENLKTAENPRKDLISIKQELKEEAAITELQGILQGRYETFQGCKGKKKCCAYFRNVKGTRGGSSLV